MSMMVVVVVVETIETELVETGYHSIHLEPTMKWFSRGSYMHLDLLRYTLHPSHLFFNIVLRSGHKADHARCWKVFPWSLR